MQTQVWAFAKVDDPDARASVYREIYGGRSRFGRWDQKKSLHEEDHGKNGFLLRIRQDDWIVHVNMPEYGRCVAVQATGEYGFDDGIQCSWANDFQNYIPVNPQTILEFDRSDPNIVPSVNLTPMRRGQRILQVEDFLASLRNFKSEKYSEESKDLRGVIHLREKVGTELLPQITSLIHAMNKRKDFEKFLHHIFDAMPNTLSIQNGFGWRTDHGADLIVEFQNPIIGVNLTTKLVVQAKSFEGDHYDLEAADQIAEGIGHYDADGGLLITTGNGTEELETYVSKVSDELAKTIDIIAGTDVARFVLRYAPDLLVGEP